MGAPAEPEGRVEAFGNQGRLRARPARTLLPHRWRRDAALARRRHVGDSGLSGPAADARAAATRARADLEGSARALSDGNEQGARRGIRAANLELAKADAAARRTSVRVAGWLPVVSSPVADLRHLLAAGHILAGVAGKAVTVQERFTGAGILHGGRIDLAKVTATRDDTIEVLGQLERPRRELNRVRGGWLAPGAAEARDASLRQLDQPVAELPDLRRGDPACLPAAHRRPRRWRWARGAVAGSFVQGSPLAVTPAVTMPGRWRSMLRS
jgi:hypothetical protein